MKNNRNFLLVILIFGIAFLFFSFSSPVFSQELGEDPGWKGLVPCGRDVDPQDNESAMCTLCELIVGIYKLFTYGLYIIIAISLAAFFVAGVMYIVSFGNESTMQAAKKFMLNSMIGLVLVACAWLIVDISLYALFAKPDLGVNMPNWYTFNLSCPVSTHTRTEEPKIKNWNCAQSVPGSDFVCVNVGNNAGRFETEADCLKNKSCGGEGAECSLLGISGECRYSSAAYAFTCQGDENYLPFAGGCNKEHACCTSERTKIYGCKNGQCVEINKPTDADEGSKIYKDDDECDDECDD